MFPLNNFKFIKFLKYLKFNLIEKFELFAQEKGFLTNLSFLVETKSLFPRALPLAVRLCGVLLANTSEFVCKICDFHVVMS